MVKLINREPRKPREQKIKRNCIQNNIQSNNTVALTTSSRGWRGSRLIIILLLLCSCSTAPKKPAEISVVRNRAWQQLELANTAIDRGSYEEALQMLIDVEKLAYQIDNSELIINTALSRGNAWLALDNSDNATKAWDEAEAEAAAAKDPEMQAMCRIYRNRAAIILLDEAQNGTDRNTVSTNTDTTKINSIIQNTKADIAALVHNQLAEALGWTVIGLAEKLNRNWDASEAAFKKALAIHEKALSLELAAYDNYLIASLWSVAGDYDKAIAALENALAFDRRAENTHGLISDWEALSVVYEKAGRLTEAARAKVRSEKIIEAAQ